MGSVYRKIVTKALPKGAELFSRGGQSYARWKNRGGKTVTAKTINSKSGETRITIRARTYTARFRDATGRPRNIATGCRDEIAANGVLKDLQRRAELVKAKVLTASEDAITDYQLTTLESHFVEYRKHLEAKEAGKVYCDNTISYLKRLSSELGWSILRDIDRGSFDGWLAEQIKAGVSARTRNAFRNAWVTFCNWCSQGSSPRLASNPLESLPKANEKADPKRQRRAMTEAELIKLLAVARRRPLDDAMTIRAGKNAGKKLANLCPDTIARLELLGRERALIYRTLVLTGLRKNELASLTVGQLQLEGNLPYAELAAADEKNREGSSIPLRRDLADDLMAWVAEKKAAFLKVLKIGAPEAPEFAKTPVFNVPAGMVRILNRDLVAAKIPKRDDRGRTLDVHALRYSFGTLLSKGGVTPRVAQEAMRHSNISLTMQTYTDPRLLDIHGALDALPSLPLNPIAHPERSVLRATGTDDLSPRKFAPEFAPHCGNLGAQEGTRGKMPLVGGPQDSHRSINIDACFDTKKGPFTAIGNDPLEVGAGRFELPTSCTPS